MVPVAVCLLGREWGDYGRDFEPILRTHGYQLSGVIVAEYSVGDLSVLHGHCGDQHHKAIY